MVSREGCLGSAWNGGERKGRSTRTHGDLRACVPPVSGPVEEVWFLKVPEGGEGGAPQGG